MKYLLCKIIIFFAKLFSGKGLLKGRSSRFSRDLRKDKSEESLLWKKWGTVWLVGKWVIMLVGRIFRVEFTVSFLMSAMKIWWPLKLVERLLGKWNRRSFVRTMQSLNTLFMKVWNHIVALLITSDPCSEFYECYSWKSPLFTEKVLWNRSAAVLQCNLKSYRLNVFVPFSLFR